MIDKKFEVKDNIKVNHNTVLLKLKPEDNGSLPEMYPGQFANILVNESGVFLRRPISICNYDNIRNELWLLVKDAGKGTHRLCNSTVGDIYEILIPLGSGFKLPNHKDKILLCGGGVGIAPLYFLGKWLRMLDLETTFLIGARTEDDLIFTEELKQLGSLLICTDDGSAGWKGVVTTHEVFDEKWDVIYTCGPLPMMKAVASKAKERGAQCQVSLENHMACGLGACLCCVEKTVDGNKCVCKDGPVFNINDLTW